MTPKEKAIELVDKFNKPDTTHYPYVHNAQQCALIAVDELIKYQDYFMDYVRMDLPSNLVAGLPYKYWDKVKQEIEKL